MHRRHLSEDDRHGVVRMLQGGSRQVDLTAAIRGVQTLSTFLDTGHVRNRPREGRPSDGIR